METITLPVEEQSISAQRGDVRPRDGAGLRDHQVVEAAHAAVHHAAHAEGVLEEVQQHGAEVTLHPTHRRDKGKMQCCEGKMQSDSTTKISLHLAPGTSTNGVRRTSLGGLR